MTLPQKIYSLRIHYGLTQVDLGKIAGVSNKTISTWELGIKEPRLRPLQAICAHFGIDFNSFIDTNSSSFLPSDSNELSPTKQELLDLVDSISDDQAEKLLSLIKTAMSLQ